MWHRDDTNTYNNRIINNDFMDENSKNNNYMEDNKICLRVFIISSSRDGKRERIYKNVILWYSGLKRRI